MIELIILTIIVGIIALVLYRHFKQLPRRRKWDESTFSVLIRLPMIALIIGGSSIAFLSGMANWTEVSRENQVGFIYSLRNDTATTGNFFIGSGSIDSTEYYYTFQKDDRGGYFRLRLYANDCILFQDNTNQIGREHNFVK